MKFGLLAPITLFLLSVYVLLTLAANSPCPGKRGGIAGCNGDIFLCNDDFISASKRSYAACLGNTGGRTGQPAIQCLQGTVQGYACGSGSSCMDLRGGAYCLTSGSKKSYRRK